MSNRHTSPAWRGVWPMTDDGVPVITQSMVSSFASCPREVYYASVLGLKPRRTSIPLTRGTWVHALLEERANGGDWRKKHQELIDEALTEHFEEEVHSLATECYNILLTYDYVYQDDPLTPVAAELTLERPMFGGKALYRGRVDLIAHDKAGDIWFVDHKTHAQLPDWRYRELAFQGYSYLWAAKKAPQYKALGIDQPRGFVYDYCKTSALSTPTLTTRGKLSRTVKAQSTSYPVFRQWLMDEGLLVAEPVGDRCTMQDDSECEYVYSMLGQLAKQSYADKFRRDYLTYTPGQAKRQVKSFLVTAKRMLDYRWGDPDIIERNLGACSGYMCHFKDLTVADLMHGDSSIEQQSNYVKTHNPLDYYPSENKGENQ